LINARALTLYYKPVSSDPVRKREGEREREREGERAKAATGSKLLPAVGSNDDECFSWRGLPRKREQKVPRFFLVFEVRPVSIRDNGASTFSE